jgi:hypothetical protein
MYGMSPMRRALYFILPLVLALILTGIVVIDAAYTPHPDAAVAPVDLPEGHNWVLFDFSDAIAANHPVAGATVSLTANGVERTGEVPEGVHTLLFDLGEAESVQNVGITWPDGRTQSYDGVPTNTRYRLNYPATATTEIIQWFEMNGPLYRLGGFVLAGLLLILFAVRIVFWAESRRGHSGEVFMR